MKKNNKALWLFLSLLTLPAFTAAYYNSTGQMVGVSNAIKCSTGLTCTKDDRFVKIVSSPTLVAPLTLESGEVISNTVDDTVKVKSNDEVTTLQVMGFQAKNAVLALSADEADDTADTFSLTATTSDTLLIKNGSTTVYTMDSSGNVVGSGANSISGVLRKQVASTSVSITAAQCGSSFVSDSGDVMNLPEASTAIGCRLTFICNNTGDLDVNPDNADIILPTGALTPSTGDAIRCTDVGAGFVLEAVSASQWAVLSTNGTITDVN